MPIWKSNTDQTYGPDGVLVGARTYDVDVTTEVNGDTLRARMQQAMAANTTWLGLTATQKTTQHLAQTERLTRECTALMRLALNALDSVDGT